MKIEFENGYKGNFDKVMRVTTQPREKVSIFKLALLINQLGINEKNIRDAKGWPVNIYSNSINDALNDASKGINWASINNIDKVRDWCLRYHLRFEMIEKQLKEATSLLKYTNATA